MPILRLLPSVCHDCGRDETVVELVPYLSFKLCRPCISARDRALIAPERKAESHDVAAAPEKPRRAPARKAPAKAPAKAQTKATPAKKKPAKAAPKASPKKPSPKSPSPRKR